MARDFEKQARVALKVFVDRTHRALDAFMNEDLAKLDFWLHKRKIAFLNFRAAEDIIRRQGISLDQDLDMQALWSESAILDMRLTAELEVLRQVLQRELTKESRVKREFNKIKKYKSLLADQGRFVKSV